MHRRKLGRHGLEVSALGLGCMGMSEFYGTHDRAQSIATLSSAVEIGVTFWDTADIYGRGANEDLLGAAFRDRPGLRERVTLATKFGLLRGDDGAFVGVTGRPEYVKKACDASLRRLGVEHIDLYYQHRVDAEVPIEDTVGAMQELVQAGKIRWLGLSEAGADTLRRASAVHPITALQSEWSLWSRDIEARVVPACRELGIGIVAYSPLGRGFLTGAIRSPEDLDADDWRRDNPRFTGDNFARNLELVAAVETIASEKGCTAAQLALAWVLARGSDVVPIPGTRSRERLDQNAAATGLALSADDLERIERVFPADTVAGTRYPEGGMAALEG